MRSLTIKLRWFATKYEQSVHRDRGVMITKKRLYVVVARWAQLVVTGIVMLVYEKQKTLPALLHMNLTVNLLSVIIVPMVKVFGYKPALVRVARGPWSARGGHTPAVAAEAMIAGMCSEATTALQPFTPTDPHCLPSAPTTDLHVATTTPKFNQHFRRIPKVTRSEVPEETVQLSTLREPLKHLFATSLP